MGRRKKYEYAPVAVMVLIIMIFWFISKYPHVINMDAGAGALLISLFPAIFVGLISIYTLAETGSYGRVPGMMGIGMSLCFLIGELDTHGLVTAQMLSGLTISQVQIWVMVISTLLGGVLYAYQR